MEFLEINIKLMKVLYSGQVDYVLNNNYLKSQINMASRYLLSQTVKMVNWEVYLGKGGKTPEILLKLLYNCNILYLRL